MKGFKILNNLKFYIFEMIYTNSDGGSRGNPGLGAIGVIIREDDRILEEYGSLLRGKVTNNVAEYLGLIRALKIVTKYTTTEITCVMDSELVIKQLLGEYRVKNPTLLKLFLKVQELQENFTKITYVHKPRTDKYQKMADWLLNKELDKEVRKNKN